MAVPPVVPLSEALRRVGHLQAEPPRNPVVERDGVVLVLLAILGETGSASWRGILVEPSGWSAVGERSDASELAATMPKLAETSRGLVDLLVAAGVSYVARIEELGRELDRLESQRDAPEVEPMSRVQRGLLQAHRHQSRLERVLAELAGALGTRFPGIGAALPRLTDESGRTTETLAALLQSIRDLAVLRTALEANRLAASANELARTSNEIAAYANTSNLRMLGVAYVALAIALVSVVVLIPNTGATILGMPSAAWVPGIWVDAILVVLAVVPLVWVFTRPWVRRLLGSSRAYEARSAEGLSDLPEISPASAGQPDEAERLIRERP